MEFSPWNHHVIQNKLDISIYCHWENSSFSIGNSANCFIVLIDILFTRMMCDPKYCFLIRNVTVKDMKDIILHDDRFCFNFIKILLRIISITYSSDVFLAVLIFFFWNCKLSSSVFYDFISKVPKCNMKMNYN